MICYIGDNVRLIDNLVVHVQDTDFLALEAKVGVPDKNGIVWDTRWVSFDYIINRINSK